MLYTEGIRKIFTASPGTHYGEVDNIKKAARDAGYGAFNHNGVIYIRAENIFLMPNGTEWIPTIFRISDFEVEGRAI